MCEVNVDLMDKSKSISELFQQFEEDRLSSSLSSDEGFGVLSRLLVITEHTPLVSM